MAMAKATSTTPSIAEPQNGSGSVRSPSRNEMSTSSGLRVISPGTSATSSKPYARRALLPMPISRPDSLIWVRVSMGVRTPRGGVAGSRDYSQSARSAPPAGPSVAVGQGADQQRPGSAVGLLEDAPGAK